MRNFQLFTISVIFLRILENHWKARYSFCDFIKRERFYIYLFLGLTFVVILGITVYIMAMREQLSFGG